MKRLPAAVLTRNMWNYGLIGWTNDYVGNIPVGLSYLPSGQPWLKQSDITTVRTWIHSYWPSHYLRHTSSSNVGRMDAFNDLADAVHFNLKYQVSGGGWIYHPDTGTWGPSIERGSEYIMYSKVWQERTGAAYDYYNVIAAGRAIPDPAEHNWWIYVSREETYTDADRVGSYLFYMGHENEWWNHGAACYNRQNFINPETGEYETTEETTPPTVDPNADRIPTIVTAEDGSRTYLNSITGSQEVIPAPASEPRSIYIARVITYS